MAKKNNRYYLIRYKKDKLPVLGCQPVTTRMDQVELPRLGLVYAESGPAIGDWTPDPDKLRDPVKFTLLGTGFIIFEIINEGELDGPLLVLTENHMCPDPKGHPGRPCFFYSIVSEMT